MAFPRVNPMSRRLVMAALPAAALAGLAPHLSLAQPTAADAVSFYLGQVLALATLQAQAVRRLMPLLSDPTPDDPTWQTGASAEAGVIAAVAAVLGAMEPPAELMQSVDELRQASAAYRSAADATRLAATGDDSALSTATGELTEGASHILLWLDALQAATGTDWGDGLRLLTGELPVATPAASTPTPTPEPSDAGDDAIIATPTPTNETGANASGKTKGAKTKTGKNQNGKTQGGKSQSGKKQQSKKKAANDATPPAG
jgi:hypothetical protein